MLNIQVLLAAICLRYMLCECASRFSISCCFDNFVLFIKLPLCRFADLPDVFVDGWIEFHRLGRHHVREVIEVCDWHAHCTRYWFYAGREHPYFLLQT